MIECGICFEEYQEGDLELHRQTCVLRLLFRCSLCDEDFVSKEGLSNHLDLHEIVDESKELHYLEIKAKHKMHQCILCNDQRAYSEDPYWKHVHDVHDDFFLQCSDCGENFQSEELKNVHAVEHCKARDQKRKEQVAIEVGNLTSDAEQFKRTRREQNSKAEKGLDNRMSEDLCVSLNTGIDEDNVTDTGCESLTTNSSKSSKSKNSQFACNICGITFYSKCYLLRHKSAKFSCLKGDNRQCPHCRRVFLIKEYEEHFTLCKKKKSCELCPRKFKTSASLEGHMKNVLRAKGQVTDIKKNTSNLAGKSTTCSNQDKPVSSSDPSSISNADTSTAKKNISNKRRRQPVKKLFSTKCAHCGKEYVSATFLRKHIYQNHQPTKCSVCGVTLQGNTKARYHKILKHTKPKYECAKCSKKFYCMYSCRRHTKACKFIPKVAAENPSSTTCSHCGIKETSSAILARHILMHHDSVACDFCGLTWPNLSLALDHMHTMHKNRKYKCPHCSMRFCWSWRMLHHVSKCEKNKLPCEFCGKKYENKTALRKHRNSYCPVNKGGKGLAQENTETSLPPDKMPHNHSQIESSAVEEKISSSLVEGGLSKTKCYYCYQDVSSSQELSHHLKNVHKLTKCDICGITVLGISDFKYHKIKSHKEPKQNQFISVKRNNKRNLSHDSNLKNLPTHQDHEQAQNDDLKMYSVEETTILALDDQTKSIANQSIEIDVSYEQSLTRDYEGIGSFVDSFKRHLLANSSDDDSMDNQATDKESLLISDTPLTGSSERQTVSETTSQRIAEHRSKKRYSCNICGITLSNHCQTKYHKLIKHTEAKYQCPHCSRKFHHRIPSEKHAASCANLKHSCELCGQKFNRPTQVENHKKRVHCSGPLRSANIEGVDSSKEQKQNNVKKIDTAQEVTVCIMCRVTFASTDKLMKHKLTCNNHATEPDNSQFNAEEISKLHGVKEARTNSTIVRHGENIELKLEIEVEETMLQEQECQVPNTDPERLFATTLHLIYHQSNDVGGDRFEDLDTNIKVKEEYPNDENEIFTEHQNTTKSTEYQEVSSERNDLLVRHEVMASDVHSTVAKRKRHSQSDQQFSDRTKPRGSKRFKTKR